MWNHCAQRLGWHHLTDGIGHHGLLPEEHHCDAFWHKIFATTSNSPDSPDAAAGFYVATFCFLRHLSEYWKSSQKNCFLVEGFAEHLQVRLWGFFYLLVRARAKRRPSLFLCSLAEG